MKKLFHLKQLFHLMIAILLASAIGSCRSVEFVPVETVKHDSIYINRIQRDSIYRRDSIYVDRKGDTIRIYRDKYRFIYRDRVDTVFQDRVQVVREAYPVEKKLTWYQSALIYLGGLFVVYIILTIYIKLKKP